MAMTKIEKIAAKNVYDPPAYSQAIRVTGAQTLVFVSGQVAYDHQGGVLHPSDFKAQAREAFRSVVEQVQAAGGTAQSIVKLNTYLTDVRHRADLVPIREEIFGKKPPASALVGVTGLARRPLTGIIAGYHVPPYILVGPEHEQPSRSVEVRGRIKVSPRLVIRAGGGGPTYGEIFHESELMDRRLLARVFSFRYASRVALESEELRIRRHDRDSHGQLERVLEELAQREVINTGVIISPDVRFYPVSVDRFIREILDQEFRD